MSGALSYDTELEELEEIRVVRSATRYYGRDHHIAKVIEEMAELQQQLAKQLTGEADTPHLAEETADVVIALAELIRDFNIRDGVLKWRWYKIGRLKSRLLKLGVQIGNGE
jgi:NTP pyrophosphatase (non-canonical NTP hydrolase)